MSWIAAAPAAYQMGKDLGSGDKKDDSSNTGTYSGDTAANIALNYYNESQPLRWWVRNYLYDALNGDFVPGSDPSTADPSLGNFDPTVNPIYQAGRGTIEDQYGVAKENIIGNTPSGGQLTDKLADLETSRADALGGLAADSYQDLWNKAFQYSTGAASTSQGTLSGLAGSEAMLNAQKNAQFNQNMSELGYALGQISSDK